jgi:hypothetical protein
MGRNKYNGAFLYFYEFSSTLNSLINEQILHGKLQARWKIYHLLQSKLVDHQFSGNSFSIQG